MKTYSTNKKKIGRRKRGKKKIQESQSKKKKEKIKYR